MTILPITLTISAAAALINVWLAVRVSHLRMAGKVSIGDGGVPALTARMRAHANFVEYAPFFLILLGLIEMSHGSATWLWLVAIVFIVSRFLHAFGMDRPAPNALRAIGIGGTLLTLVGLAAYALATPYMTASAIASARPTAVIDR